MADDGSLSRFQRRMQAIPKAVRAAVRPALVKGAEEIAGAARHLAPEDTGALRGSIAFDVAPIILLNGAAARLADKTRLPSLELGGEHGGMAGNCDSGYSCVYSSTMSWRSASACSPEASAASQASSARGSDSASV